MTNQETALYLIRTAVAGAMFGTGLAGVAADLAHCVNDAMYLVVAKNKLNACRRSTTNTNAQRYAADALGWALDLARLPDDGDGDTSSAIKPQARYRQEQCERFVRLALGVHTSADVR